MKNKLIPILITSLVFLTACGTGSYEGDKKAMLQETETETESEAETETEKEEVRSLISFFEASESDIEELAEVSPPESLYEEVSRAMRKIGAPKVTAENSKIGNIICVIDTSVAAAADILFKDPDGQEVIIETHFLTMLDNGSWRVDGIYGFRTGHVYYENEENSKYVIYDYQTDEPIKEDPS